MINKSMKNEISQKINAIRGYLSELYKYYTNGGEENDSFTFVCFQDLIQFPMIVASSIFKTLDVDHKGRLSKDQFAVNMAALFSDRTESKIQLMSHIFDLDSDGIIQLDDIKLYLSHFFSRSSKRDRFSVDTLIKQNFGTAQSISINEFINVAEQKNSDIVFLFDYFLSKYKPFSEGQIQYFAKIKEQKKRDDKVKRSSAIADIRENTIYNISKPSETALTYLKVLANEEEEDNSPLSCLETFESDKKFVISSFNCRTSSNEKKQDQSIHKDKINCFFSNRLKFYQKEKNEIQDIVNKNNDSVLPLIQLGANSPIATCQKSSYLGSPILFDTYEITNGNKRENLEIIAYQIEDGNFKKRKLVLIDDALFYFKLSSSKSSLRKVIPFKSVFVEQFEKIVIGSKVYYPFHLLRNFLNKKEEMIFLGTSQTEVSLLVNTINEVVPRRRIEDDYELKEEIGKGKFGVVYKCINKFTGKLAAAKYLAKSVITDFKSLEMLQWEIDMFQFFIHTSHPGVIKSKDYYETINHIYFVYEYIPNGDLNSFLLERQVPLSKAQFKSIAVQIADAINYIHKFGIVHRDIKPHNIMVTETNSGDIIIKLTDFGLSKVIGKNQCCHDSCGTLMFASPELLINSPHTKKVDIWSFAVILYYIYYGNYPFDDSDANSKSIIDSIVKKAYRFPYNSVIKNGKSIEKSIQEIIKGCLKEEIFRVNMEHIIERLLSL